MDTSEDVESPVLLLNPLSIPYKTLLGAGPANCPPRVLHSAALPLVGHLHKECLAIMDEIKLGLQYAFQTHNTFTLAVSATGHGGMEACLGNLIESGDTVLVAVNGLWGERAADMASRYGGKVILVEKPAGENFSLSDLETAIAHHSPALLFIVHGESSTGVLQPLEGLGPLCHKYGCLLLVDAVATLGAIPLFVDRWQIDAIYSGSQKVLGAPPGLAPLTLSSRACAKLAARKTSPTVFYFDLNLLGNYWGCDNMPRRYHHTIPVTLLYALREGLAGLVKEGLKESWRRHSNTMQLLHTKILNLGMSCFVSHAEARLPTISTFLLPDNINIQQVLNFAMQRHHVEIAGGLGPTSGRVVRIGLMGFNATPSHVELVVKVLKQGLNHIKNTQINSKL